MFQTKVVEKIKTHILCLIFFFFRRSVSLSDNAENMVEPGKPQMTIWRMRITRLIPIGTNTHSQYVILVAHPLQQWLHEHASMLRYTYTDCLVWNCCHLENGLS